MTSRAHQDATNAMCESMDTNATGNMHLINLFMPLVLKGKAKRVVAITTGMADIDFINQFDVQIGTVYACSKAALNVIIAKFNAQYKKDGVLCLSVSPGAVNTGNFDPSTCMEPRFPFCFPQALPFSPLTQPPLRFLIPIPPPKQSKVPANHMLLLQ